MQPPHILSQEEMIAAIAELDQAIYTHEQWTEEIYAALICRLPADVRDIDDDAHRKCRFGQWYYGKGSSKLWDRPGFTEVEAEHKHVHECAAGLLRASAGGRPIPLQDYERFVNALKRLRLEIQSLKREFEVSLYNIDALTGVPGRMEMLRKLREQHEFVRRGARRCAVAMLDVDLFKSVNDTYGHLAGDHVLVNIAQYARLHLRPYDLIFRYGGEEFLLCMPDTDVESCREICDRLRIELAGLSHKPNGDPPFQVTVSIGVVELGADYTVEEAIDRADRALLAAKAAGRNRCMVWSPAVSDSKPAG